MATHTELTIGKKAPQFTLESTSGQKVSLKDYLGQYVVLYFYPKDNTPGCTTESCDFRDKKPLFTKKKAVIFGISKDSIKSHEKFIAKQNLNFELLADVSGEVCEKYGAWGDKKLYGVSYVGIIRSTFVIDPEGKIVYAKYGVKVKDHVEEVLNQI